jgi:hypothetical protein
MEQKTAYLRLNRILSEAEMAESVINVDLLIKGFD